MTPEQQARYARQIIFAPLGASGQEKLIAARVVVVGCGANGTVIANTLARAGVGTLVIADRDFVEWNNLQRQVLFDEEDVRRGAPKAVAAAEKLRRINALIHVEGVVTDVNAENIEELIAGATVVCDGTDNFSTRFLINDACVKHNLPWVYGGAVGSNGMSMTIIPRATACLRCVFAHEPAPGTLPTCDTAGVLAPIVNVIGSLVAAEAIKLIAGAGERNPGLTHVDVWENTYESFNVGRRADCVTCVENRYEYLEGTRGDVAVAYLCGRNAVQVNPGKGHAVKLTDLAERLQGVGRVTLNEYLLRLEVGDYEITVFPDARAVVKGTEDAAIARGVYSKFVGV